MRFKKCIVDIHKSVEFAIIQSPFSDEDLRPNCKFEEHILLTI